ncbi:uncharacterized protein TRIADDRAFT_55128 [Trichoplax adhaerens]|uniref:Atos-like conserved domain-containing protein n=1 Tax=Trichoplax adhaerens TaxID=10228 RepID=B3RU21_TRIAD|nr:hypothetical protein TRIADDRAFT_55128 [Trichoplax adhaerens]EDV25267.1 hypothetical protein TRIADDRAFT_55128 [Trichoplax adhaerens]|eukprot:XP_002111300.1 hypothetical protein TRIADDRAFT_55128 [Trichoplax adhaerens]
MDVVRQITLLITQSRLPHLSKKGFLEGPDYPRLLGAPQQIKTQLGKAAIKQFDRIISQNKNVVCIEVWVKQSSFETITKESSERIADLTWPQRVSCPTQVNSEDFVLMEQWMISVLKDGEDSTSKPTPMLASNLTVKSMKSHLYYSQIRAMMQESQGQMPSNVVYKICSRDDITKCPGSPLKTIFPATSLSNVASLHLQVTYQPSFIQSQQNNPNKRRQSIDLGLGIQNRGASLQTNGCRINNREVIAIDNRPRRNSLAECAYIYNETIEQEEVNVSQNKTTDPSAVHEIVVNVLKNVESTKHIDSMNQKNGSNNGNESYEIGNHYNSSPNRKNIEIAKPETKNFYKQKTETIDPISKDSFESNNETASHRDAINKKVTKATTKPATSAANLSPKMKDKVDRDSDLTDKTTMANVHKKSVLRFRSKSFSDREHSSSTQEVKVSSPISPRHSNVSRFKMLLFRLHLKELTQSANDIGDDSNNYRRRSSSLGSYKQKSGLNTKETDTTRRSSLHLPKLSSGATPAPVDVNINTSTRSPTEVDRHSKLLTAESPTQISGNVAAFVKGQRLLVHQKRCSSPPIGLHEQRLLGNFEESVLNNRLESSGRIQGFKLTLSVVGSSAQIVTLPMNTFYYNVSDNKAPSPYLGIATLQFLNKSRYHIPKKGTLNMTIYNPQETIIKVFKSSYDLSDMPGKSKTFLRQRTTIMTNRRSDKHTLLYVIHLR